MTRIMVFIFLATVVLSYVAGMLRAIPALEVSPSDRNLLRMLSFIGITLTALDGISSLSTLSSLVRRLVFMAAIVALIGIVEFQLGHTILNTIHIPGLVEEGEIGPEIRGDFLRPSSTAIHPLEYASALASIFPLALASTMRARGHQRTALIACTALIGVALVIAGSRSSIIGLTIGVVIVMISLTRIQRLTVLAASLIALSVVYVTSPGLIGTLRYMFLAAGSDSSVLSRTDSLGFFDTMFAINPFFGRGIGTFISTYQIFDNQLLGLLVETGVVGTTAFILLFFSACADAIRTWASVRTESQIAAALLASCCVLLALSVFFDSFSFAKSFGLIALLPGICGALQRLSDGTCDALEQAPSDQPLSRNRSMFRA